MKVTTRKWKQGQGIPPLWDVLINGKTIGGADYSRGRVLKSPWGFMPVSDDEDYPLVKFDTLSEAAQYVAERYNRVINAAPEPVMPVTVISAQRGIEPGVLMSDDSIAVEAEPSSTADRLGVIAHRLSVQSMQLTDLAQTIPDAGEEGEVYEISGLVLAAANRLSRVSVHLERIAKDARMTAAAQTGEVTDDMTYEEAAEVSSWHGFIGDEQWLAEN